MGPPQYTWETCKNITAMPSTNAAVWRVVIKLMNANGNYEFDQKFLPPMFCDPFGYKPPDLGLPIKIVTLLSLGITVLVVIARYLTRIFVAGRIGWDDWTIVMATMLFVAESGTGYYGVTSGGLGRHSYDNSLSTVILCLKVIFTHSILYTLNVFMVKASLLFFYKRLFPKDWIKTQRAISWFIVFNFAYAIASCLVFAFHCSPVHAFWDISKRLQGCPSFRTSIQVYTGIRGASVLCDIFILVLPMKYVWGFKLPLKHRLGLACIFGLGFTALAAALLRLFYQPKLLASIDISWRFVMVDLAAQLEHSLAIITASIPALTALWRRKSLKETRPHSVAFSIDSKFDIDGMPGVMRTNTVDFTANSSDFESSGLSKSTIATFSSAPIDGSPLANVNSLREPIDYLSWAYHPERQNGNYANAYGKYSSKPRMFGLLRSRKAGGSGDTPKPESVASGRWYMLFRSRRGIHSRAESMGMGHVHVYGHQRGESSTRETGIHHVKNDSDENLVRTLDNASGVEGSGGAGTGGDITAQSGCAGIGCIANRTPTGNQILMTNEIMVKVTDSIDADPIQPYKSRHNRR
ncbi:hypothetical protein DFH27DRAFT_208533 [Peziza echinospora]|nr:hypothetical protein DFH27DRAFT_208533 [Peziza echinospora]